MKNSVLFATRSTALLISLSFLSSCTLLDRFKKPKTPIASSESSSTDNSTVLCSIDGKPAIRETDFMNNLNQMLQANPYFRGAGADALPMAIKRKVFDELVKQELIIADATKNNVENDAEFQKAFDDMKAQIKRMLKVQFFEKKIFDGINVKSSDVSKYFNENKDKYVKVPGGVLVSSVVFDDEAIANEFLNEAKANRDQFEQIGKSVEGGTFKDFGRVGKEARGFTLNDVPAALKDAALNMNTLPGIGKVKVGKQVYVFKASDRKTTTYFDLDEIKPQIEALLKNNTFKDVIDSTLEGIKSGHSVSVNEEYFKDTNPTQDKELTDEILGDNMPDAMAAV